MKEILAYLVANIDGFILAATTIVTAASAITALTPTPKDDAIASQAYKIIDWLALNIGKAKDKW